MLIFFISFATRHFCCLSAKPWLHWRTNFSRMKSLAEIWCFFSTKDICGQGFLAGTKLNCFSLLSQHKKRQATYWQSCENIDILYLFFNKTLLLFIYQNMTFAGELILTVYHDLDNSGKTSLENIFFNKVVQDREKWREKFHSELFYNCFFTFTVVCISLIWLIFACQ